MPSYHKPVRRPFFKGPLYDKMADDLHLTGKAQRTVHGYLRAVRQLADCCRKSREQVFETELRRYFLYLKNDRQAAYETICVALSGIQFFYRTTCPRDWNVLAMPKLKKCQHVVRIVHPRAGPPDHPGRQDPTHAGFLLDCRYRKALKKKGIPG